MSSIFGTDGIRDRAGEGLLALDQIDRILSATAAVLRNRASFPEDFGPEDLAVERPAVLVGRDTRDSGVAITRTLTETLTRQGHPVIDVGVLPTPAVAQLTDEVPEAGLGIMISASHNPAEYNGIKFLAPTGAKVSDAFEEAVSAAYHAGESVPSADVAGSRVLEDAARRYHDHLVRRARHPEAFRGLRVVLDMAHGATAGIAREVFETLGCDVLTMGDSPDGTNINEGCGATEPELLARQVVDSGADLGFAFDGDGDRMIPVTARGSILDGDHILAIAGKCLLQQGRLPTATLVTTVMANLGLEKAAEANGLKLIRTPVGDRHVYREMVQAGHGLGGEQSGHIIFLEDGRTGDGILAALRLVDSVAELDDDLDSLSQMMRRYPQVLLNYRVARKVPLETLEPVQREVESARQALDGDGRIVLRYSGTEPLARVMIEGPDQDRIQALAERIGETILACIPD